MKVVLPVAVPFGSISSFQMPFFSGVTSRNGVWPLASAHSLK